MLVLWSTPTALKKAGRARIRNRIAKRSPRSAERLADAIWDALTAQGVTIAGEGIWGETISDITGDLDRICDKRDRLAGKIEAAFQAHPLGKILDSMCGFGPRTGSRTLAEIGDPHRFADGGRLASYAGLVPVDWQSGRSAVARKPRGGNHRLKNALFTAAFIAISHDPDAKAYYRRKRDEGKRHNAALICVARRRSVTSSSPCSKTKPHTNQHHNPKHHEKNLKKPLPTRCKQDRNTIYSTHGVWAFLLSLGSIFRELCRMVPTV